MSDSETQFLDTLYRGAIDGAELSRALQLIQDLFHCRGGALVAFDAHAPATDLSLISGLFADYGRLYLEQFVKIDPAPVIFSRLATGTASATKRMLTAEEQTALPFVNEFF